MLGCSCYVFLQFQAVIKQRRPHMYSKLNPNVRGNLHPNARGNLHTAKTKPKSQGSPVAPGGTEHGLSGPARAWGTEAETETRLPRSH